MSSDTQQARIDKLFREVAAKGMSRRQMITRAAALGISPYALTVAFTQVSRDAVAQGADNPLNVDPAAPLDVVIFKGGYGDDYAINVNDTLYGTLYPDAAITYSGTQRLEEQYQSQVVEGSPPDVMDNSGAGNFNTTTLYNDGQLADLSDLMAAPAYGQEGVTFADSLIPGSQETGVFDGKQFILKYVYSVYGIWYNAALMEEKGWEYPTTWDDMLALCQTIVDDGEYAPWTYQGLYPYYIRAVFDQLVHKAGGIDAQLKLDNLAEDAWTQPVVKQSMDAIRALYDNGYVLEGTEGLSHTESQAAWIYGEAVFLPCGGWLANEMKDQLAEEPDFQITVKAIPSLSAEDTLPQTAIAASAGEDFIVFANGANVQGGKEWLRLLFSQEGAAFFSEVVQSLTVVSGVGEGQDLGQAFNSAVEADTAAGDNKLVTRWSGWYSRLNEASEVAFNELMTGVKTSDQIIAELQAVTDELRNDPSVPKFTRQADGGTTEGATPAASPVATPAT